MCCTTLNLREATMATTELTRAACQDFRWPQPAVQKTDQKVLRMNWVVATDENGTRRLRVCWASRRE